MRICIVGAGLSGLACASRLLANEGVAVNVFEESSDVGGLAGYTVIDGTKVPKTYRHVLRKDKSLHNELNRLGIPVAWRNVKIGFYVDQKIHPFGGPIDLLRFDPLSLRDRLRLGWLVLGAAHDDALRNVTAEDWVRSRVSGNVFEDFIDPLLSSYFGSSKNICAAYLVSRWNDESKSASNKLGYADFPRLIDSYVEEVARSTRGKVRTCCSIKQIHVEEKEVKVDLGGEEVNFDAVIMSCPPPETASMVTGVPSEIIRQLRKVRYRACLCLLLKLERKVSNYYWINVLDKSIPFIACFEHGNLNPTLQEGFLYAVAYVDISSSLWSSSDEEIHQRFKEGLEVIFGKIPKVKNSRLFRIRNGTPIYEVGYENVAVNPYPRLYLAGIYRAFPAIRSSGPAIASGIQAAQKIIEDAEAL